MYLLHKGFEKKKTFSASLVPAPEQVATLVSVAVKNTRGSTWRAIINN